MSRQEFIDTWFEKEWKVAKKSGALYVNIQRAGKIYNVSVVEDDDETWKWQIETKDGSQVRGKGCSTDDAAKRAALDKLADILELE